MTRRDVLLTVYAWCNVCADRKPPLTWGVMRVVLCCVHSECCVRVLASAAHSRLAAGHVSLASGVLRVARAAA